MEIENIPISEIVPYSKNPRKNDKAVDVVAKSIKEFGFKVPIILDKENVIIAGHTRLKAAIKLGMAEVPIIWADDLTPEQVKAFRIMDNRSNEFAEWDTELLKQEFYDLEDTDLFNSTGFTTEEISLIWDKEVKEDDYEIPKEPKYKIELGEMWILGNHRLMCGDSTKKEDVDKLMNGQKADMVFTDPPYGVDYSSKNEWLNSIARGNRNQTPIINDNIEDYSEFFNGFLSRIKENLSEYNAYYITISGQKLLELQQELRNLDMKQRQILIWAKNNHVLGRQDYANKHELIVYGWSGKHKYYGDFCTTIWEINKPQSSKEHPTMKPIELCVKAIKNSSQEKMCVLDLFGGSGSTLIACEQTKRKCYMMELDPIYCSVIIERWEKLTSKKATKIDK